MKPLRIGLDYRVLAVGADLVTRGMGRYTQRQTIETLAVDPFNQYVVLCPDPRHLALLLPEIRDAPNVNLLSYPTAVVAIYGDPDAPGAFDRYLDWVTELELDVYHLTTPFLGRPFAVDVTRFDACPMVATVYDLIPMIFRDRYSMMWPAYQAMLDVVKGATRILAISDSARADAISYLGVRADDVDRAWPSPEPFFRPHPPQVVDKVLLSVRGRMPLPHRYLLSVVDSHYTKNVETLFRAYGLTPRPFRMRLPLVLCTHYDEFSLLYLRKLAEEAGILDDLVLTGVVADGELAALYNRALMLVHPSRYEGFGLPVVEAMRCGTPVITTTASSLPEVAGAAALLVDTEDERSLAEAIMTLAADEALREALIQRGFVQSARFSGRQLGLSTLECYRAAARVTT